MLAKQIVVFLIAENRFQFSEARYKQQLFVKKAKEIRKTNEKNRKRAKQKRKFVIENRNQLRQKYLFSTWKEK